MSLYVPLLIRLEIKKGACGISFDESSSVKVEQSPSVGEKTRRRLMSGMKRRSPQSGTKREEAKDSPVPDSSKIGKPISHADAAICRGRRTYSEVVVETLEADRLTTCSETSTKTKASSEPPPDIDRLNYYYGNPSVEKTEGILHFYKYNDEKIARQAQCRMLCIVAVPSQITATDLVNFIGPAIHTMEHLKIVRDTSPNRYYVIIKFKTHNDTVVFYEEFNGTPFCALEPGLCTLLFVDKIECVGEAEVLDVSSFTEIPTCVVCLERLDEEVLTVLCNHTFHAKCLQEWAETTCPVCRYVQTPQMVAEQRCSECGEHNDLWICLICGNVGCGRYAEGHAYRHFELTSHPFCLQIGGVRVWDYAGDNYVHRLIQTDSDGKIVEYSRGMGGFPEDKNEKMDSIKMEYTCLLSSQLEQQRLFFEARIADVEKAMSNIEKVSQAKVDELESQLATTSAEVASLKTSLSEMAAAKNAAEKKCNQITAKLNKVTSELAEEKSLNELLRGDQQGWKAKLEQLEKSKKEQEQLSAEKIQSLKEQVTDLMLHFEAQTKLNEANVRSEEVDTVHLNTPTKESSSNSKQRRKSHRK